MRFWVDMILGRSDKRRKFQVASSYEYASTEVSGGSMDKLAQ